MLDLRKGTDEEIQPLLLMDSAQEKDQPAPAAPVRLPRSRFGHFRCKVFGPVPYDESRCVLIQKPLVCEPLFFLAGEYDPTCIAHDPAFE
jgi:hypothetical protein